MSLHVNKFDQGLIDFTISKIYRLMSRCCGFRLISYPGLTRACTGLTVEDLGTRLVSDKNFLIIILCYWEWVGWGGGSLK